MNFPFPNMKTKSRAGFSLKAGQVQIDSPTNPRVLSTPEGWVLVVDAPFYQGVTIAESDDYVPLAACLTALRRHEGPESFNVEDHLQM